MKATRAWEKEALLTHIPPFFVICSNLYSRILDRCSHSCAFLNLTVNEGKWYDISWTYQEQYPVWNFVLLGRLHITCVCTSLQPQIIGVLGVEQQQWCFLLSSLFRHIVHLRIHALVKYHYWSNHPTHLWDHCSGIQLTRKLTYSLNFDDLPSLWAAQRLQHRYNSYCPNDVV